jgi:hypothetical protein
VSQGFKYVSPGLWTVDLGTEAIRLGQIPGLVTMADMGGVGMSSVVVDNPDGTVGHSNDQIVGWKQFTDDELAETAGNRRVYTGYITSRTYRRRVGSSLIVGPANEIGVSLSDLNELLSFKLITGTDGNRPAETVTARMTWLLASTYLSGLVYDHGFVAASSYVMDANDYTGQNPQSVILDMALAVKFNFYVYYHESSGQASLWFDKPTSPNWDSGISISNLLSDINPAQIVAGTASTFYALTDAELVRDPTRCYSGVFVPYQKGHIYVTNGTIESNFTGRDGSAPNANVKTAAAATVIGNNFLADNATEDDRITCTIQAYAPQVNAVLAGQYVQAKFTHFPGYTAFTYCRVLQRSVAQSEETDQLYDIQLILSPVTPESPVASFARITRPNDNDQVGPSDYTVWFDYDGDNPHAGDPYLPRYGLLDYYPAGTKPALGWQGIKVFGTGTLDLTFICDMITVVNGTVTTHFIIAVNGVTAGQATDTSSGGLRFYSPGATVSLTGIAVTTGDIITARITMDGENDGDGQGFTIPTGTGASNQYLQATGSLTA